MPTARLSWRNSPLSLVNEFSDRFYEKYTVVGIISWCENKVWKILFRKNHDFETEMGWDKKLKMKFPIWATWYSHQPTYFCRYLIQLQLPVSNEKSDLTRAVRTQIGRGTRFGQARENFWDPENRIEFWKFLPLDLRYSENFLKWGHILFWNYFDPETF